MQLAPSATDSSTQESTWSGCWRTSREFAVDDRRSSAASAADSALHVREEWMGLRQRGLFESLELGATANGEMHKAYFHRNAHDLVRLFHCHQLPFRYGRSGCPFGTCSALGHPPLPLAAVRRFPAAGFPGVASRNTVAGRSTAAMPALPHQSRALSLLCGHLLRIASTSDLARRR